MAKTAKRKTAKRKAAPKRTARPRKVVGEKKPKTVTPKQVAASQGAIKKSRGKADLDPNQKTLPIIEETDRIPAIETAVKKYLEAKSRKEKASEDMADLVSKLPPLFKKHDLSDYSCLGHKVLVTHGADEVKFKKAKTQ